MSGVLANIMKTILPDIIGNDQKGLSKIDSLVKTLVCYMTLFDYLIHTKKAGLLLLIDFEQAFDSLNFMYIREVLKSYNFGETYISWFNLIYNDVTSCVVNNGLYV